MSLLILFQGTKTSAALDEFCNNLHDSPVVQKSYLQQQRNVPDVVNIMEREDILNLQTKSVEFD